MTDKIEKLKSLLKLVDESISRSDFELAFKTLTDFIKKVKEELGQHIDVKTQKALDDLAELYNRYLKAVNQVEAEAERIKTDNEATLSNIKKWALEKVSVLFLKSQVNNELAKRLKEVEAEFNKIAEKADEIRGFEFPNTDLLSKTASDLAITAVLKQVPTIEAIEADLPKLGDKIRDGLELLQGDDRLDKSAIKGLEEEFESLRKLRTQTFGGGGGGFNYGSLDIHIVDEEVPTEVPNGVITDFTLQHTPSPASSLKVYKDGQRMKLGASNDYTLSGLIVSFVTAPLTDSLIIFEYRI